MRKLCGLAVAGALGGTLLIGAPSAPAAIEVGSNCQANIATGEFTILPLGGPPGGPPLAAPSAGVVTKWKVNSGLSFQLVERLRIFRPTGNPGEFQTVAESAGESYFAGQNAFETRIPVQAGDRFGAFAPSTGQAAFCSTGNPEDVMGYLSGEAAVGSTHTYASTANAQAAVSAIVEPDADGDGYGDETQDKCPQLASTQSDCTPIALGAVARATKGAITVLAAVDHEAPVTVTGQVKWSFKPKHKARTSKNLIVGLSGGTQTVKPGQIARFNVKLPKTVKLRLSRIPPTQSLKAKLTAGAKNVAGQITSDTLTVKLKGQAGAK